MAFSHSWALKAFSLFPGGQLSTSSARPLQMGSFLLENPLSQHHHLGSPKSVDRTSSISSEGLDLEFDAVLLDVEKYPTTVTPHVPKVGSVSQSREVKEWLEAAVFGGDEDFGALLVEPLRARVALGPIHDDIFGLSQGAMAGTGGHKSRIDDCTETYAGQLGWPMEENQLPGENIHRPAVKTPTDGTFDRLEGLAGSGTPLAARAEHDMFETVMGVVQSAMQEYQGPFVKQDPHFEKDSWAVIAGTVENRVHDVSPKNLRKAMLSETKGKSLEGSRLDLARMDAEPGKGYGKTGRAQQGLSLEGCSLFQEWGPVKEERNPRLKAGKWKSHGRRKSSPPPRRMGNFGTGKFCGVCSPALSNRLQKRKEVRRECIAGEMCAG